MYKNHDLENDLLELAEGIDECVVGSWWDIDKGCGCPMAQLAIYKGISTPQDIEDEYVKGIEVQGFLEDRFMTYYPGQGHLIRRFPIKFDHTFDDIAATHSTNNEITYTQDHDLIKKVMIEALAKAKETV